MCFAVQSGLFSAARPRKDRYIIMELNQIKQFRAIARTESISKAAELLFISQPSLSQTLKRLEAEIGTPLFERHGKRIALNGAGKIFLKYCDEIVASLDSASKEIGEYIGREKSDINILVNSSSLIILEVAEKMRRHYPWSLPHFYQGFCDNWDLKICSELGPDCGVPSKVVIEEPIGIILPKEHSLASKKEIYKKDLEDCSLLSLNPSDGLTKVISHFCTAADFKPNVTMFVESPSILQELLKKNFGIAFAPKYTWHSCYGGSLVFRQVEDMPMRHFVHVVLNDKSYITKEMQCCYEAVSRFYMEYVRDIV